ncbi:MAG: pyruvate, phosphate dikinase [Streptosporangiaceae bacterium]|jgi:pyruvate,orthophosphate dikinase|nr:pyruvate, phosphate dikinase [Streptosporangiaceae bacterium]
MIELPRAALTAGRIAEAAEFFSAYLDKEIFTASPFDTLDRDGVGRLVRIAVDEGRAARPGLKVGVCGEHGGDPDSIHFFHDAGLDYVSCSTFRVPVARLEAGRAALTGEPSSRS